MHDLVVSPFLGEYLVLRPGETRGVRISWERYNELCGAPTTPLWLAEVSRKAWNAEPGSVLVRRESELGYGKASYELNLGCNYRDAASRSCGLKQR